MVLKKTTSYERELFSVGARREGTEPMDSELSKLDVGFFRQENFTVCIVRNEHDLHFVGVAKRMASENDNPERGEIIALTRAGRSWGKVFGSAGAKR